MNSTRSAMLIAALLILGTLTTTVHAITDHPLNVALTPGDTLYIRFKLDNPSLIPADFNAIGVDFTYAAGTPSATTDTHVYDDNDVSVGVFNSIANFMHFGIGPEFIDPSLSNPVSNFCCGRAMANLASYLDGTGMTSLAYQAGPGVTVSNFRALFGNSNDSGSSFPHLDTTIAYGVNTIPPPFVPEPATTALALLGAAALLQTRRSTRQ